MKNFDFKEAPLRDGEFRLLILHQGQGCMDLECNLIIRSFNTDSGIIKLDTNGNPPARSPEPYEALSYTWGPTNGADLFVKILMDSEAYRVAIRPNLDSALRKLRHPDDNRLLWIDAICIDQDNRDEKSSQIPMMWEIYNTAFNVCIWLGRHEDDSERAMKFITECLDLPNFDRLVRDSLNSSDWAALSALARRPWFSRRWIVQEIAVAKNATLHCGDSSVNWRDFADAISLFSSKQPDIRQLFRQSTKFRNHPDYLGHVTELAATRLVAEADNIFRKSDDGRIMEHMLSLEALMSNLSAFEATDPHDTVYAILWVANDARPISKSKHSFSGPPQNDDSPAPHSPTSSLASSSSLFVSRPIDEIGDMSTILPNNHSNRHGMERDDPPAKRIRSNITTATSLHMNSELHQPEPDGDCLPEMDSFSPKNQLSERNSNATCETNPPNSSRKKVQATNGSNQKSLSTFRGFASAIKLTDRLADSVGGKRITVDYKKSVFEVYRDFIAFTINRSKTLNMICRPWAPDYPELPSWIPCLSRKAFGLSVNKVYRRVNADPLVGNPGSGRNHYNAAPKTFAIPIPLEYTDKALTVKGFVLDRIREKKLPAVGGIIPAEWLITTDREDSCQNNFWRTLVGNRDSQGQKPPSHWGRACKDAFSRRPVGGNLNTADVLIDDCPSATRDFVERVQCMVFERRLVILDQLHSLGLAPSKCKKGDLVCILFGCSVPVLLRKFVNGQHTRKRPNCDCLQLDCRCGEVEVSKTSKSNEPPKIHYDFIGECYVHGMMDGEATRVQRAENLPSQLFDLK